MIVEDKDVPTNEGSLTHFYYEMSEGQHVIKGTIYPSVVVTPDSLKTYVQSAGSSEGGLWAANADVIDIVAADMDSLLLEYDVDDDNTLDYLFIYYYSNKSSAGNYFAYSPGFTGVSQVGASHKWLAFASGDSLRVNWDLGSTMTGGVYWPCLGPDTPCSAQDSLRIHNRDNFVGLAAHEYGHDALSRAHVPTEGAYGVMDGSGSPKLRGTGTIVSAFLRRERGWINPIEIDSTVAGADTTITLKNAATEGEEGCAVVRTRDPDQYFILECRNAEKSPYLEAESAGSCAPRGLAPSGLVISHITTKHPSINVQTRGWQTVDRPYAAPGLDIEVARGMFDTTSVVEGDPDPIRGLDNMGIFEDFSASLPSDPFQPGSGTAGWSNVFAPYTNPNTNLYADTTLVNQTVASLKRQTIYSGIHVYNIE